MLATLRAWFRGRVWRARVALILIAGACLATSRPTMRRNYPMWTLDLGERQIGCARVDARVKKSGKTGIGVVLSLRPIANSCSVEVQAAQLDIGGQQVSADRLPAVQRLHAAQFVYLPFIFDNEAAWNEGRTDGSLRLTLRAGSSTQALVLPMRHRWDAPHVSDRAVQKEPCCSKPTEPQTTHAEPDPIHGGPSAPLIPLPPSTGDPGDTDFAEPPP